MPTFLARREAQGYRDERDMFPEAVRAVRELRPKAFIFENVKGLMRETFASYCGYIELQLMYPGFVRGKGENWKEHRERLERHHTSRRGRSEYKVIFQLLNAADYGVPQRRERVFMVGFRADLDVRWSFPPERKMGPAGLFTGSGGRALGVAAAGSHHDTVVERNKYCFRVPDGWPR
jgi:site-specific DNA-cytosine methylase